MDFYRGFPLTMNESKLFVEKEMLPEDFKERIKSFLEFGSCSNCDNVRCMHFVLRDWWSEDIDKCDGWCCPFCNNLKPQS